MKKLLLLISVIAIFASCKNNNSVKVNPNDSTTVTFIDTLYNFGTLIQGETVSTTFKFKNTGDKPLVISQVMTSCGCTVPTYSDKPVTPGSDGFIKVTFNSNGKHGDQYKIITIVANTKPERHQVYLKGNVRETSDK